MIVRINQVETSQVERESGWLSGGLMGPFFGAAWPADMRAFELLVLEHDEQQRPLSETFRQTQLRHIIPEAAAALREKTEELVVRLDGPLADGELLAAFRRLTDDAGIGRYAFSAAQKAQAAPQTVISSVRLAPTLKAFAGLSADSALGLERSVRLRVMAVPDPVVSEVLELGPVDDPRWAQVLPQAGFMLGPSRGLRSIHILSRRFDAASLKARIMQRLIAGAGAEVE